MWIDHEMQTLCVLMEQCVTHTFHRGLPNSHKRDRCLRCGAHYNDVVKTANPYNYNYCDCYPAVRSDELINEIRDDPMRCLGNKFWWEDV